nr:MAG TPA: Protein of unknown function (DUF551) [Caudoviricetes sp.]
MMNVLEKILEEIEHEAMTNKEIGRKQCEGMARAMNIVSSHLNEFLNCEIGNNCHVYDIDKIIRSHMDDEDNDGWIPVEDGLPEVLEKVLVWYEYFRYGEYDCMFETYGIGWQLDGHWSGDVSGTKARCIAWQPLPEPYKPNKDNSATEHIMSRFMKVE